MMFEDNCLLLNTKQYTGIKRVRVELWLLFEDQGSSVFAKITQMSLLILIIFSTVLILVQSYVACMWAQAPVDGRAYEDLEACDLASPTLGSTDCTRVCERRLDPLDPGGPIHFYIAEAFCMVIFTVEVRGAIMPCAPAQGRVRCRGSGTARGQTPRLGRSCARPCVSARLLLPWRRLLIVATCRALSRSSLPSAAVPPPYRHASRRRP